MGALTDAPRMTCRYCGDPWPGATPWVCRCGKGAISIGAICSCLIAPAPRTRDGRPLPAWLRWMHGFRLWRAANWLYRRQYGIDCPIPPWGHR